MKNAEAHGGHFRAYAMSPKSSLEVLMSRMTTLPIKRETLLSRKKSTSCRADPGVNFV